MSTAAYSFRHRLGPNRVNDEVGSEVVQVESVVEPVGEGTMIVLM
jgi:hypothetical protein